MLGASAEERAGQAAEGAPGEGETGAARDQVRRLPRGRRSRARALQRGVRSQVPEGGRVARRNEDSLLSFFDSPAEHWQHLRTTNAIESTFATVRLRQRVTKGAGSRTKAFLMAFKLLDMAQKRWRRVTAPHLVAPVREGVPFTNGTQVRNAA